MAPLPLIVGVEKAVLGAQALGCPLPAAAAPLRRSRSREKRRVPAPGPSAEIPTTLALLWFPKAVRTPWGLRGLVPAATTTARVAVGPLPRVPTAGCPTVGYSRAWLQRSLPFTESKAATTPWTSPSWKPTSFHVAKTTSPLGLMATPLAVGAISFFAFAFHFCSPVYRSMRWITAALSVKNKEPFLIETNMLTNGSPSFDSWNHKGAPTEAINTPKRLFRCPRVSMYAGLTKGTTTTPSPAATDHASSPTGKPVYWLHLVAPVLMSKAKTVPLVSAEKREPSMRVGAPGSRARGGRWWVQRILPSGLIL
mmetsp:Transcript_5082/g.16378  ORF Transcript_5082/g.16378 Transcript_5082/m.16378 type:complete len:310 (-) Transcript_5082:407-1336(-)